LGVVSPPSATSPIDLCKGDLNLAKNGMVGRREPSRDQPGCCTWRKQVVEGQRYRPDALMSSRKKKNVITRRATTIRRRYESSTAVWEGKTYLAAMARRGMALVSAVANRTRENEGILFRRYMGCSVVRPACESR
jgi:hypothetical protein